MKKKSVFFTSILCLFCSVSGYSIPLEEEIKGYQDAIKKAHESVDVDALKNVNERFKRLSFGETEWKNFANRNNIPHWSSQSERQRVGGWLFYPKEFDETQIEVSGKKKIVSWGFLDNPYQIRFTERIDYIWALTIASQHKHPIARYYLCRAMIQALATQADSLNEDRKGRYTHPSLNSLKEFYGQCIENLQKDAELNQDAKDIITYLPLFSWNNSGALNLVTSSIMHKSRDQDVIKEAVNQLATLSLRSQLKSLEAKKRYAIFKGQASQQSFLDLAKNYPPAYKSFIDHFDRDDDYDHEKSEEYLDTAIALGHRPSYIDRGHLYIRQGEYDVETGQLQEDYPGQLKGDRRIEQGLQQFQIAVENGLSQGYIEQGIHLLGKNPITLLIIEDVLSKEELKEGNVSKITEALNFFEKAADQKDPQGYYLSAHLNRHMLEYYEAIKKPSAQEKLAKEQYEKSYKDSLENASKLGSIEAYCWMENYLNKAFKEIAQTHPPLYGELWEKLMNYIKADNQEGPRSDVSTGRGRGRGVRTKQSRGQV